jgi:hypothetical protein
MEGLGHTFHGGQPVNVDAQVSCLLVRWPDGAHKETVDAFQEQGK